MLMPAGPLANPSTPTPTITLTLSPLTTTPNLTPIPTPTPTRMQEGLLGKSLWYDDSASYGQNAINGLPAPFSQHLSAADVRNSLRQNCRCQFGSLGDAAVESVSFSGACFGSPDANCLENTTVTCLMPLSTSPIIATIGVSTNGDNPSGSPFTLHPSPFTLHPSPFTLHPSPFTLHHAPFTLHPSPSPTPSPSPPPPPSAPQLRAKTLLPRLRRSKIWHCYCARPSPTASDASTDGDAPIDESLSCDQHACHVVGPTSVVWNGLVYKPLPTASE